MFRSLQERNYLIWFIGALTSNIGTWMQRAVSAIRGAGPSPFAASFDWGYVTAGESSVYLHVADLGKQELSLRGIASAPDSVRDLGTGILLPCTLSEADGRGPLLNLELAAPTDELPRTIELAFTELPRVDQSIVQVPGSPLRLDVWNAETGDGLTGTLETEAGSTPFTLRRDGEELYPILHYWKVVRSEIGVLHVSRTGQHKLNIEDLPVVDSKWDRGGVNMIALRLEPVALA